MLYKVEVTNNRGSSLELPLADFSLGYIVEEITGLDPVKATIVTSGYAQQDGVQYQSSKREGRNLVFQLKYEPTLSSRTVKQLRKVLYDFFMPKTPVTLNFYDDEEETVEILGRVESFDSPLFAEEPKGTISIICPLPDFYDPTSTIVSNSTVSDSTEFVVDYDGSTETGVEFKMMVNRTLSDFIIYHRRPDNSQMALEFDGSLLAGDVLTINTNQGLKGAILTRAGSDSSVLYWITTSWIEMTPGPNRFRVYAEGAAVPFTIEYATKYGGL
jgi:hypothetical protein